MFPIYRKNHIWSSISRSPDLRSLLRNSFPDWRLPLQWIMFRNSLSQWRDRTGFTPVSLLIRVCKIKNILLELIEAGSKPTNVIYLLFYYILYFLLCPEMFCCILYFFQNIGMGASHAPGNLHWHVRRPWGDVARPLTHPWAGCLTEIFVLWGALWKILLVFQVGRFLYKYKRRLARLPMSLRLLMFLVFPCSSNLHLKLTNPTCFIALRASAVSHTTGPSTSRLRRARGNATFRQGKLPRFSRQRNSPNS